MIIEAGEWGGGIGEIATHQKCIEKCNKRPFISISSVLVLLLQAERRGLRSKARAADDMA